jgi:hypothetical protein
VGLRLGLGLLRLDDRDQAGGDEQRQAQNRQAVA